MTNKVFLIIFSGLFIFFIIMLIAESQGYYQNRNSKAKALTDEQIIEFEEDIKQGKSVDVKKYVLYEEKDYSTNISNNVYKTSLKLESIVDAAVKIVFNNASKAVND